MSNAYVIEVRSRTVGIVVRDGRSFHFHSALSEFDRLEGQSFRSAKDAEKAALRCATPGVRASAAATPAIAFTTTPATGVSFR